MPHFLATVILVFTERTSSNFSSRSPALRFFQFQDESIGLHGTQLAHKLVTCIQHYFHPLVLLPLRN